MKTLHRIFVAILLTLCTLTAVAEQVNVTISPKRTVLPPQVMLYIANPGQYFNITVQNPETEPQAIFFGAEIHQLMPSGAMDIVIPAKTMPKQAIIVPAGQSRVLDVVQLRTLFNHVRQEDIQMPQGLFGNVMSGTFGMLEEGTYELVLNAYKWDPTLSSPVLLSNPSMSRCTFTVCYQASAPKWISPVSMNDYEDRSVATLSQQVPMLQWSNPVVNCNPTPIQYTYDLKIVQMLPLQAPDEAMDRNPVVYQKTALTMPQCIIPATNIRNFAPTETYVAQVTVHSNNTQAGVLDFVNLQNDGKSDLLLFRVKDYTAAQEQPKPDEPDTPEVEKGDSIDIFGGASKDIESDSLYVFKNPEITSPAFSIGDGARKTFTGEDIGVEWRKPWYRGGRGTQPDSLRFAYDVKLYAAHDYMERQEMLQREPVLTLSELKETTDTIRWETIKDQVGIGDYLLLQVLPRVLNETSVEFVDDSVNVVDFALTNRFTPNYFECSNGLAVTNTTPTRLSVADLQGKTVKIGEYDLVLDGAQLKALSKQGHFQGTGHVIWEPMKFTWKLAVKFDDIAINTDNEVYEGVVETFEGDKAEPIRGAEVVDKLFTDWGIDNLIGDTGIPYANMLQEKVNGKVSSLADELGAEIGPYYQDIKAGKAKVVGLFKGNLENVTFPLAIPDNINPLPVDLQISKMKFAPTYATMDFFGMYVVPETEATRNQILIFGAPRICISPKSLVPEGTTIALLKDFTVKDPRTDYDCTFKAPKDVIKPEDGCYVSWSNGRFEAFRFDVDMTLPNLKKVVGGKATEDRPQLHITADIKAPVGEGDKKIVGWDWYGIATLDPFEHEDLPGYTFHAGDKVYIDHSSRENVGGMPAFPKDYDLTKAGLQGSDQNEWMGIYIDELSMEFPQDIKVGNGKERMKVSLSNMFIDKSGMTVEAGIVNAINYKAGENGTIGGFAFSLDEISVNFIQNQHKDFGFRGRLEIPLFKGTVRYDCKIYNQRFSQKGTKEGYAYVFKTYQMEGLSFDFMLGDLTLNDKLTYFLVEALPDEQGNLKTNVELLLGGEVTIAGQDKVNAQLAKLPMDLTLPGIRFCNLRVANNKSFESTYEPEMQLSAAKLIKQWTEEGKDEQGKQITWWNESKDIALCGGKLYLNLGQWGYASPQKKIGPFNFALTKYDIDLKGEDLAVTLGGDITFNDELNISAGTTISIYSTVKNVSLDNISDISLDFKEVKFDEARLGVEVTGFKLDGVLTVSDTENDKGYGGTLSIVVANGLFELQAAGGYFDHTEGNSRWSYGYFFASGRAKMGIPMGPISLKSLKGGFYFNCAFSGTDQNKNPLPPRPSKGAIGIIFGLELATADGHTLSGNFDMAVCVLKNQKTNSYYLSTFNMQGGLKCLDGVIDTRVTILYEDNDQDRFFQLNCTVDATADGFVRKYAQEIKEAAGALQQLTGKVQNQIDDARGELSAAFSDSSTEKSGKNADQAYKDRTKNDSERSDSDVKATAGASASLDLRIQSRKNGQDCSPVLWHVYLGQPDEDKRCKFILVDFKSKIVTVSVGASAYLCIGSELPNNGQLPPLPEKVERFLNGDENGGVQSDSYSTAVTARKKTINEVLQAAQANGGVMLGASVWGYIDVDLGLFFGSMGATAGFDVSVVHYGNSATCVNLGPGTPGYNHWYGQGQLYAYLYAKFGFKINLGFFKKRITLVDAGLGGVLKAQLPNPNHFEGKARCKIKLLGGLVKIDKKFSFTCGQGCDMFLGNALDNYQLFEDCTIATDKPEDMQNTKISWQLNAKPQIATQGTIKEVVRVLDPTEEARIKGSKAGQNIEDFTAWASRSFRFILANDSKPKLIEYETYADCKADRKAVSTTEVNYTINGEKLVLNLTQLNADRYYRLVVDGQAQEFRSGRWMHPETWDSIKGRYVETPWHQRKIYYFATDNSRRSLTNVDDLEDFTRVAFPMAMESVKEGRVMLKTEKYVDAPTVDIRRPMISLSQRAKSDFLAHNKGSLVWMVCPEGYEKYQTGVGESNYLQRSRDYFYRQPNQWIENDSVSILTPAADFPVSASFRKGVVKLVYEWQETVSDLGEWKLVRSYNVNSTASEASVRANALKSLSTSSTGRGLRSKRQYRVEVVRADEFAVTDTEKQWQYRVNIYRFEKGSHTVTFAKELYSVPVNRQYLGEDRPDNYIDVYTRNGKFNYWANYCATRLDNISISSNYGSSVGMNMMTIGDLWLIGHADVTTPFYQYNKTTVITKDAVAYLSYLSNLFFIGGYRIKSNSNYLNLDITTSESLRLSSPFTSGFVQGGTLKAKSYYYQVAQGYNPILHNVLMGAWTGLNVGTPYPLYDAGDDRMSFVTFASGVQKSINGYKAQIKNLYEACAALSSRMDKQMADGHYWNKKSWRNWLSTHKNPAYMTVRFGDDGQGQQYVLEVPYYQFAVLFRTRAGSNQLNNIVYSDQGSNKHWRINKGDSNNLRLKMLWGAYMHSDGAQKEGFQKVAGKARFDAKEALSRISSIQFTRYRVNAWNFKKLNFTVYTGQEARTPNGFFVKTDKLLNPFK